MARAQAERPWIEPVARVWHGLTALLVATGLGLDFAVSATGSGDTLRPSAWSALNILAYFTVQSNLIVGITALLLAVRPYGGRLRSGQPDATPGGAGAGAGRSTLFCIFRLDGLVMIIITAVVFHTMLAGLFHPHGWSSVSNQLVHTAVPALAVIGWLLFGPRGLITWRVVGWSLVYPILWAVFTLVRGVITDWYPYPFMDVGELGWTRVLLTLFGITVAFLALAAGALGLDRLLTRSPVARGPVAAPAPGPVTVPEGDRSRSGPAPAPDRSRGADA